MLHRFVHKSAALSTARSRVVATVSLFASIWLALGSPAHAQSYAPPFRAQADLPSLRFDQTYYAQVFQTYRHSRDLLNWLDAGYFAINLDVIDDWNDDGPLMDGGEEAGDTNCGGGVPTRLGDCLKPILHWVTTRDVKIPVLVTVTMSQRPVENGGWGTDSVVKLDKFIASYLGETMYTYPALVSAIGGTTGGDVRERLKANGWPLNSDLKKRIIVSLKGGKINSVNQNMSNALEDLGYAPATFLCPDVDAGDPDEISGTIDGISQENSRVFVCTNLHAGDRMETSLNRASDGKQMILVSGVSGDFKSTAYAYNYMKVAHGGSVLAWDANIGRDSDATYNPGWLDSLPRAGLRRGVPVTLQ